MKHTLIGTDTLKTMYPKVNENFSELEGKVDSNYSTLDNKITSGGNNLNAHENSSQAHTAKNISYNGDLPESNAEDAIDNVNQRVSNIIAQSGSSDTEVVDARYDEINDVLYALLKDRLTALTQHTKESMPHVVSDLDTGKKYKYGLQIQNGVTQFIYEEVV